jgi:hypothetical protein
MTELLNIFKNSKMSRSTTTAAAAAGVSQPWLGFISQLGQPKRIAFAMIGIA